MTNSELYDRASKLIPWASQTNSKRYDTESEGLMPAFIESAEGCRVRDVEGRWFIDYKSALGPIILGYRHPAVEDAVRAQMQKGVLFSMPSPIEIEVAETFIELVPSIEQIRFLKTGNDVNQGAIRLARAFTKRDHLAVCGYHGYGDWFTIGTDRTPGPFPVERNGVPRVLDQLVTRLPYGNLDAAGELFDAHGDDLAAVLTVPYDWNEHVGYDFLNFLRRRTEECGALLIFDQVLTGFRIAKGGAQEYFDVVPDLTTYAKAVANGYPLAAYGGRRDVMAMLDHAIVTSTYAGETLSLAAAAATLGVIRDEPVVDRIWHSGRRLMIAFDELCREKGLPFRSFGLPPAVQFRFHGDESTNQALRMAFFKELFRRGVFPAEPFLMNYAHDEAALDETIDAMGRAVETVSSEPEVSAR